MYSQLSNIFRYFNIKLIKSICIDIGICVPASDSIWCDYFCDRRIKILDNKLRWWIATNDFYHRLQPSIAKMGIFDCFHFYLLIIGEFCATLVIRQGETYIGTVEFGFRIPTKKIIICNNVFLSFLDLKYTFKYNQVARSN